MSKLYNKIKKNVLASKDADAINQLDVMEGKVSVKEKKAKGGLVRFKKQYQMHNGKF
jgi:hypothetical protein